MSKRRLRKPRKETAGKDQPNRPKQAAAPVIDDDRRRRSSEPGRNRLGLWPRKEHAWLVWAVCAFLLLAVGLVFGQTLGHPFMNFDDNLFVYDNPQVNAGLTLHGIIWAFTAGPFGEWYPLSPISDMLDCQLFGLWAGGHHLTNVLLHAAAAILLFLVLLRMTSDLWPSAFVAVVFAVHPLHVESVAWIAERRDVLSGLFFMLTLGAYVGYVRQPSGTRYLAVAVLFALGLMAKPMLVTLPFVLLLLDYWPLERFRASASANAASAAGSGQRSTRWTIAWRLVREKIPLFALAAADCTVTLLTHPPGPSIDKVAHLSLQTRVANALVSCAAYLGQLFYPVGLAPFYPHPADNLPFWKVAGALLMLTAISASVFLWRRKHPYLLVGWFWYLGMMVPVLGFVQVGKHAMADRYTYLSQIGLYVTLAWGIAEISRSWPSRRWVLGVSSAALLGVLMACAWQQTSYWCDAERLWNHTLACTSPNALATNNLGIILDQQGRLDEAIACYEQALKINPNYATAHYNLANTLARKSKLDEAISHFEQALKIDSTLAPVHNNMANELVKQGRIDEAIAHFEQALKIDPNDAVVHYNFSDALSRRGKINEAIAHYEQALKIDPNYALAHYNLATALAKQGKYDEAVAHFEAALKIRPDLAPAHSNLGNVLAAQGKTGEAIAHYKIALKFTPNDAASHNNLANVLAAQGKIAEAMMHYRRTLEIDADDSELAPAHSSLANMLARQGKFDEAIAHWRKAIRLRPNETDFLYGLAWALATSPDASMRNGAEAFALADRANQLSGGREPAVLDALAAACAETGQFPKAVETAQQALALATARHDNALAAALEARIKLYQAGSAYREPR